MEAKAHIRVTRANRGSREREAPCGPSSSAEVGKWKHEMLSQDKAKGETVQGSTVQDVRELRSCVAQSLPREERRRKKTRR